jgi:hypothetical protein
MGFSSIPVSRRRDARPLNCDSSPLREPFQMDQINEHHGRKNAQDSKQFPFLRLLRLFAAIKIIKPNSKAAWRRASCLT